jgi:hypothetical protein
MVPLITTIHAQAINMSTKIAATLPQIQDLPPDSRLSVTGA